MKAQYPLREGKVQVREIAGQAGRVPVYVSTCARTSSSTSCPPASG